MYLGMIALTLAGILTAFVVDPSRPLAESSSIALFWSWYNLTVLVLACYVCIEQPRHRLEERFATDEIMTIDAGRRLLQFQAKDISASGIGLKGIPPVPVGARVRVQIDGAWLEGRLARASKDHFGICFEPTVENRLAITSHVFSGRYSNAIRNIKASNVAHALASRVFR